MRADSGNLYVVFFRCTGKITSFIFLVFTNDNGCNFLVYQNVYTFIFCHLLFFLQLNRLQTVLHTVHWSNNLGLCFGTSSIGLRVPWGPGFS